jgi:hypothetical protein
MSINHVSIIKENLGLGASQLSSKGPLDYHPDVLFHREQDPNGVIQHGSYDYLTLFDINEEGKFSQTDGSCAFAKAHEALDLAYEWHVEVADADREFQKLHNLEELNKQNHRPQPFRNGPHANSGDLYEAAVQSKARKEAMIAPKLKELEKFQASVNKVIEKTLDLAELKHPIGIALAAEVRAHVRGLKGSEKSKFLMKMVDDGERFAVASVLKAPFFLVDMDRAEHQRWDQIATYSFTPNEARQRDAVNHLISKVIKAQGAMEERIQKLRSTIGTVNVQRAKANKALAALKNRKVG